MSALSVEGSLGGRRDRIVKHLIYLIFTGSYNFGPRQY